MRPPGSRSPTTAAQVLWDVSVCVAEGEIVALLGPNGSGKSTLMNSISRLVKLKSGRILFNGREIQAEPPLQKLWNSEWPMSSSAIGCFPT